MLTKRKLKEKINALEERVKYLENMHALVLNKNSWELPSFVDTTNADAIGRVGYYRDRQLTPNEITMQPFHPQPKYVDYKRITNNPGCVANTDRIPRVTLEELARLVIDHTPIVREEKVKSKRISNYTEDTTTVVTISE